MSTTYISGAETDVGNYPTPEQDSTTGTVTRDTSNQRSGAACWKCDSGGGATTAQVDYQVASAPNSTSSYLRAYFKFANLPASTTAVLGFGGGDGNPNPAARLTSGGKLQLWEGGVQRGSDSAATISADNTTWYRIEIMVTRSGTGTTTACELLLDGTSVASATGLSSSSSGVSRKFGWVQSPGASKVVYVDDLVEHDSQGAANTSWPGDGKVLLLKPISDNARGSQWTAGAGSTSNLWDAVDNTPPVGVADGSATNTSQIRKVGTTLPQSYDANVTDYTTAGIGASDTINAILGCVSHAEGGGTGTKTGSIEVVSNPASGTTPITYGGDAGAAGTYPTNWTWNKTPIVDAPSVTKGTSPVLRVTVTTGTTATRMVDVDAMYVYVDYTPVSGTIYQKAGFALIE